LPILGFLIFTTLAILFSYGLALQVWRDAGKGLYRFFGTRKMSVEGGRP